MKKSKSYLTKRGYVLRKEYFTDDIINKCKKELTVKPSISSDFVQNVSSFPVFRENRKKLYLPKHYGLDKFGKPDKIQMDKGVDINLEFKGSLRPNQQKVVDSFFKSKHGGLISLQCGGGKTVCGLHIISKIKKKTLVIVHKEFLMHQWKERIEQFLPGARIGIIQQNIVDIEDKDIVLGMLQSISQKDYPMESAFDPEKCMSRMRSNIYKQCNKPQKYGDYCGVHKKGNIQRIDRSLGFESYGLCIVDECHHIAAEVFSRALPKISCAKMLGLSATPNRKDQLTKVFLWYIGPLLFKMESKKIQDVIVSRIIIHSENKPYTKLEKIYTGKMSMPRMITNICTYTRRTRLLVYILRKCLKQKRKILVLSERRNHLSDIFVCCKKKGITNVGYYIGGMKQEERKKSEECDIILGTFSMASEGMDIPVLNTVILASPKSSIEQSVGRILRKKHDDVNPLIIDIVDSFSFFSSQGYKRNHFYKRKKYTITNIHIQDTSYKELIRSLKLINLDIPFVEPKKPVLNTMKCLIDD